MPYSFASNYISDLGELSSPWHGLMNGSFMLQGFLIFGGALLHQSRRRSVGQLDRVALGISAVGVLIVGLAPSDTNPVLHKIGAIAHFAAGGLGIGLIGAAQLQSRSRAGWLSILTGSLVLTALLTVGIIQASTGPAVAWVGLAERAGAYGIVLWLIANGAHGAADNSPSPKSNAPTTLPL